MDKLQELKDKLQKAKTNKMLPENMREKLISKYEIEIEDLERLGRLEKMPKLVRMHTPLEKKSKKKPSITERDVIDEIVSIEGVSNSDAQGIFEAWEAGGNSLNTKNKSAKQIAELILTKSSEPKKKAKKEKKKVDVKFVDASAPDHKSKGIKRGPTGRGKSIDLNDDYDCDAIIAQEKERAKKRKEAKAARDNAPRKTPVTKAKEKVEKAAESIMDRVESGTASKSEITKLIASVKSVLKKLESALNKL